MTTIQITLPDELAQQLASAGLLSPESLEAMLRNQLRRQAGEALRDMWRKQLSEEITPEVELDIIQAVQEVRAK